MTDPKSVNKAERDDRLEELATATREWAERERTHLKDQVALGKAILLGRTGSERLANASVTSTSLLAIDEINFFLSGVESPLRRP